MLRKIKYALSISLLALSSYAHAGFVHTDLRYVGDQASTLHEETGLEWLKLSQTTNRSMKDVSEASLFDGWRFPTTDEINTLFTAFYPTLVYSGERITESGPQYAEPNESWVEFLGLTLQTSTERATGGYYMNDDGVSGKKVSIRYVKDGTSGSVDLHNPGVTLGTRSPYSGVFLVSDGGTTLSSKADPSINIVETNDVPVSSLFGLSLVGLFLLKRKQKGTC